MVSDRRQRAVENGEQVGSIAIDNQVTEIMHRILVVNTKISWEMIIYSSCVLAILYILVCMLTDDDHSS